MASAKIQLRLGGEFAPTSPIGSKREALLKKNIWHERPPTNRQIFRITRMCIALGINEPLEETVSNRMEARDLIYELRGKLERANSKRKLK